MNGTFLHNCVICLSKFNLLSISNPSSLHAIFRVGVYIIYFHRGGVILFFFSVNNNDLELIRVYNHHDFFEPLDNFFKFRS